MKQKKLNILNHSVAIINEIKSEILPLSNFTIAKSHYQAEIGNLDRYNKLLLAIQINHKDEQAQNARLEVCKK